MQYSKMSIDELRKYATFIHPTDNHAIYRELHRRLWDWLAKDASREKADWPGWDYTGPAVFGGREINAECFMCATFGACLRCPLGDEDDSKNCKPFYDWLKARRHGDVKLRKKLARDIRDAWPEGWKA